VSSSIHMKAPSYYKCEILGYMRKDGSVFVMQLFITGLHVRLNAGVLLSQRHPKLHFYAQRNGGWRDVYLQLVSIASSFILQLDIIRFHTRLKVGELL
jgi:hypothetical protein